MNYMDEYEKAHRVVTVNDSGVEVTLRAKQNMIPGWETWMALCIDAINGLGMVGVPTGEEVVEAIELLRA